MRATTVVGWTAAVLAVRAVAWTGEVTVPPDALASAAQVCSVPNLQIPENTPAGITSQLAVPGSGMATNLRVRVGISHTWVGDLIVRLTHAASGVTITLMDQPGVPPGTFGCSGKHVFVVADDSAVGTLESACVSGNPAYQFEGSYKPNQPLAVFGALPLAGVWQLTVSDNSAGDTGTLVYWCIVHEDQIFRNGFQP